MTTIDLDRFVTAQEGAFETALAELRQGRKRSHWMWYIFPQLEGLGMSAMSRRYAITSLAEAKAYLAHPLLGSRLEDCTGAVLALEGKTLNAIFGSPDDMKFQSSMTLFALASGGGLFQRALDRYCGGQADARTLDLLERPRTGPA
jgi:uncharacterized protein (DUF1810 family)